MKLTRDQDGDILRHSVCREKNGLWGATVWFGGLYGFATNVRRYYYPTRRDARNACISDDDENSNRVFPDHNEDPE